MASTSERFFVYLQRPDTGAWVTVGRYQFDAASGIGWFRYAPSYEDAGLAWAIDPVNLPFRPNTDLPATRYSGLHDVLRDAGPDTWGQALLRREWGLSEGTPAARYLMLSSNADRWGALAVGPSSAPSIAHLSAPKLPQLDAVVRELEAMAAQRPPLNAQLRRRLVQTASVGGARPKATVRDAQGLSWLVKPKIKTDEADVPRLEHAAQRWGSAGGLRFAETVFHPAAGGTTAVRVRRFDRHVDRQFDRRLMCVSAASLLQAEYPGGGSNEGRWSYPRLAEELQRIGAPLDDRRELFGRMIFNAVCGNDDDHVRNHAVVYQYDEKRWRLSPAFDVVPNPAQTPQTLAMQLSSGRFDICRESVLADAHRFGFTGQEQAARYVDDLLVRFEACFEGSTEELDADWQQFLHERMIHNLAVLRALRLQPV